MVKKSLKVLSKQQHLKRHKQHKILIRAILFFFVVLLATLGVLTIAVRANNDARLYRINQIYASLGIDTNDKYILQRQNVFGDKRVYSYDKGRTYSSEKDYIRAASVDATAKELDTAVKAAGFSFIGQPYAGSTETQYHYKSAKGEYVRITVTSKLRDDAFQNSLLMDGKFSDADFKIDPNAGPSNVVIKVNLDDNNE
ncbi:MAG: exported protein of unknown function [Candidatus Saccharibacteria bacterium]|nr:exported protein of unknown function [Candidatus Saccharibacteria bacterium]